ncbi:hypothetical protein NIES4106_61370 (plasmid) [Fischerella sp. NIES-4106]|nr:hypothetical protein NIES4106_61370 [Fischerella sp. NIES-4106]
MSQTSIVVRSHYRDPFKSLFSEFLLSFDALDVNAKSIALQGFVKELEELETTTENESIFLHWSGIFSVFSAAAVISAFGVLNPIAGILLGGTAAASAAGVVGGAIAQNRERTPTLEKLKRYKLALESDPYLNWACLWQYVGTESFFECLYSASSGYLLDGRLVRNDGKNPMAAALDGYCKTRGMKRDELLSQLSTFKQASVLRLSPVVLEDEKQTTPAIQDSPTLLQSATNTEISHYTPAIATKIDIIDQLTARLTNTLFVGLPGSGKGMTISAAIRKAKQKHPNLKIFLVDPKADPKEIGYWSGVVDKIKSCACRDLPPEDVMKWVGECFKEFQEFANQNLRTLLIIDEGTLLGTKSKNAKSTLIKDKITSIASAGDSEGINIWIAAQAPYVGSLGIDLSASSQLLAIAIIAKWNLGAYEQWKRSALFKQVTQEEIEQLIEASECDRAVFFGGTSKWYSMPSLENHSGFNRDKREFLPGCEPPKNDELVRDTSVITKLESAFLNSPSDHVVDKLPFEKELSELAQRLLSFFANAKSKEPKALSDIKKKDELREVGDIRLIIALQELVEAGELIFDDKDRWSKSDW